MKYCINKKLLKQGINKFPENCTAIQHLLSNNKKTIYFNVTGTNQETDQLYI